MTTIRALALASLLPLLAAPPADAQRRPRAAAPATARPVTPDTRIIPLPLNPVIPAGQRLCAQKTPSGLGYTMLRPATGDRPGATDQVLVNYIGYLGATGVVFDQGMRSALSVDGVIPGFGEGLRLLARNAVVRLCIPAALGYGPRDTGPIPANSDLVFQVELVDFRTPPTAPVETPAAGATPQ